MAPNVVSASMSPSERSSGGLVVPMVATAATHSSRLMRTAAKLGIAFWDYLGDRLSIPDQPIVPYPAQTLSAVDPKTA